MIYLASPYSSPDPLLRKTRYLLAAELTATMLSQGLHVYSPIVHCHDLAERFNLPSDFEFWKKYNFDMLRRADFLTVYQLPGWLESKGVSAEVQMALALGMTITYEEYDEN